MRTNSETANKVIEVINETSFSSLFDRAFGKRKAKTMIYGNKKKKTTTSRMIPNMQLCLMLKMMNCLY